MLTYFNNGQDLKVGDVWGYVGFGGGGNQEGGGAAGGTAAGYWTGEWSAELFEGTHDSDINRNGNPASRTPTGGDNSIGGRGSTMNWFNVLDGGGGGNGFKGGGGGGTIQSGNRYDDAIGTHSRYQTFSQEEGSDYSDIVFYYGYKWLAGCGGGGGGSSWVNGAYCNPDGTIAHGSGSDLDGMLFIASRV
jgi:hypothetical protein